MKTILAPNKITGIVKQRLCRNCCFCSRVNLSYSEVQDRVMVRIKFAIITSFLCLLKFVIFVRSSDYVSLTCKYEK